MAKMAAYQDTDPTEVPLMKMKFWGQNTFGVESINDSSFQGYLLAN